MRPIWPVLVSSRAVPNASPHLVQRKEMRGFVIESVPFEFERNALFLDEYSLAEWRAACPCESTIRPSRRAPPSVDPFRATRPPGRCTASGVSAARDARASAGNGNDFSSAANVVRSSCRPRVARFSCSYGSCNPCLRMTVCTASASTSQLVSRSCAIAARFSFELADPAQRRVVGHDAIAERDAQITQHRRIRKVTLPARNRQLLGQDAASTRSRDRGCLRSSRSRSD